MNYRATRALIHEDRLKKNLKLIREWLAPGQILCPMVKANAYGHGATLVAKVLCENDVDHLGVALLEEGIEIRQSRLSDPTILVFGQQPPESIKSIEEFNLTPVVSSLDQLKMFASTRLQRPLKIHLKFNTGMNRLGFRPDESAKIHELLDSAKSLQLDGLCSHFACGEDAGLESGITHDQLKKFDEVIRAFPNIKTKHLFNSAGSIAWSLRKKAKAPFGIRPGITIYGVPPMKGYSELDDEVMRLGFAPVMEFKTIITQINHVPKGEIVSYGASWRAERVSRIGVVAAGYADGVSRSLSNRGYFLVGGKRVPIVGRICMDYIMIDITDLSESEAHPGSVVTILGADGNEKILAQEVADNLKTIPYEVVTSVGARVPRVLRP